jgi:acyl carrier protein
MELQVKQIMSDILDVDAATVDAATSQDNTPNWDSMSQINLVIALEQEFGVSFTPGEMERLVSFPDILRILGDKLRQ